MVIGSCEGVNTSNEVARLGWAGGGRGMESHCNDLTALTLSTKEGPSALNQLSSYQTFSIPESRKSQRLHSSIRI